MAPSYDPGYDIIEEEPTNVYKYQDTLENQSWAGTLPLKQGLYDPELEKDACGVGFAACVPFPLNFSNGTDIFGTDTSREWLVTRYSVMREVYCAT